VILFSESCSVSRRSGSKKISSGRPGVTSDIASSITANNLSGQNFFIRRANISLTKDNITSQFSANIRYKLPYTLLITVKSKIGIEAARAYLTKDTLLINDRFNKRLITGSPEKLQSRYGISSDMIFALLGDFIIENKDEKRILNCNNGFYSGSYTLDDRRVDYKIDCDRKKVTEAYFEGGLTTGNISMVFSRFRSMNGAMVPQVVSLSDDLSGLKIIVEIEDVEIGWNGEIDFVPGKEFEVVYLK
jgi:Domain of unknown function (DUF4292)